MDPCKDNFFVTSCRKGTYFLKDLCDLSAAHTASCIRDDTVSTELVASILDFDIGTYMFCGVTDGKLLVFLCLVDLDDFYLLGMFFFVFLELLRSVFSGCFQGSGPQHCPPPVSVYLSGHNILLPRQWHPDSFFLLCGASVWIYGLRYW